MSQSLAGSLLADYYEDFLIDRDVEAFRRRVEAKYTQPTLIRLLDSGDPQSRRAAVLSLGLFGEYSCNSNVAKSLRDGDARVRDLAANALWAIWFRAGTPEQNRRLEEIRVMIAREQYDRAIHAATALIEVAPEFAEAYNQRAIAKYASARLNESADDCRKVIQLNPYHFGALSGLGQCQLKLDNRGEALRTFRRALRLQPYSDGLRELVVELEAQVSRE